jgi:hypothetical protein
MSEWSLYPNSDLVPFIAGVHPRYGGSFPRSSVFPGITIPSTGQVFSPHIRENVGRITCRAQGVLLHHLTNWAIRQGPASYHGELVVVGLPPISLLSRYISLRIERNFSQSILSRISLTLFPRPTIFEYSGCRI